MISKRLVRMPSPQARRWRTSSRNRTYGFTSIRPGTLSACGFTPASDSASARRACLHPDIRAMPGAVRRPGPERLAYFPVVAKRVMDPAKQPAMFFGCRVNQGRPGRDRAVDGGLRIIDDQQHPGRRSADGLGAEIVVLWRLVGHPERRALDRHLRDHTLVVGGAAHLIDHLRAESRPVEVHGR